jgi:hypothetical protein
VDAETISGAVTLSCSGHCSGGMPAALEHRPERAVDHEHVAAQA